MSTPYQPQPGGYLPPQPNTYYQPVPQGPAPQPPKQNRNLLIALIAVTSALVLVLLGGLVFLISRGTATASATPATSVTASPTPSVPTTIIVSATFDLVDQDTADSYCEGTGGYDDISTGASVLLLDQTGETIGSTTLDEGDSTGDTCEWTLQFADVPTDRTQYTLKIGSRGGLTKSRGTLISEYWHFAAQIG